MKRNYKKYSVTLYNLKLLWAYYADNTCKLVRRWVRIKKFLFKTKREAFACLRENAGHYVKATIRREEK